MATNKQNFSVRLDPFTRNLLAKLAEKENRTAGSYLRAMIAREAEARGVIQFSPLNPAQADSQARNE